MKKKFLKAFLFGAAMLTATSTFVSCKDYDDDIAGLQSQIDALGTLKSETATLAQGIASLQSAVQAAQATADASKAAAANAQAAADAAQKKVNELEANAATKAELKAAQEVAEAAAAKAQAAAEQGIEDAAAAKLVGEAAQKTAEEVKADLQKLIDRVAALEEKINNMNEAELEANIEELQATVAELKAAMAEANGEAGTMVTSVSLWYTAYNSLGVSNEQNYFPLSFTKAVEQDNVFGKDTDAPITFTKGNITTEVDNVITIRVVPTNAELTPDMISLINSQGKSLSEFVEVEKVEPYKDLIGGNVRPVTRATQGNGLWNVTFKLKENYDPKAFAAAIETIIPGTNNEYAQAIRFAVAVSNTEDAARLAISNYAVEVEASNAVEYSWLVNNDIAMTANDQLVDTLMNRSDDQKDLLWLATSEKFPTPAVKPVYDADDATKSNCGPEDNRTDASLLLVEDEGDVTIRFNMYQTPWGEWINYGKIKGFYVVLDKAYVGEGDDSSEKVAWAQYEKTIEGLNHMFDGNHGTVSLKGVKDDIVGLRVFAVNLDGTLVDPDGIAFYVYAGAKNAQNKVVEAVTWGSSETFESDLIPVTLTADQYKALTEATPSFKNTKESDGNDNSMAGDFEFVLLKKDRKNEATKASEVAFIQLSLNNPMDYENGKTYTVEYTLKNGSYNSNTTKYTLGVTKVMPTAFPEDFDFRPKQELTDGSGIFKAYMVPGEDPTSNDYGTPATVGSKDLNNVFYGLDENYKFTVLTSAWKDAANHSKGYAPIEVIDAQASTPSYILNVDVDNFIDNTADVYGAKHDIKASYLYRDCSKVWTKQANGTYAWVTGDWAVDYNKNLQVIYACWEDANTYSWGTYYDEEDTKFTTPLSYKPELKWTQEGEAVTANLANVWVKNSYNNEFFGTTWESHYTKVSHTLADIVADNWLEIIVNDEEFAPKLTFIKNGKTQTNPYFSVEVSGNTVTFNQNSTQIDAAPVADHTETLTIYVKDAFGHIAPMTTEVKVITPTGK